MEIQDLYDGEQQITQAMPQMIEMVQSPTLKKDFEQHLDETRNQIKKLEEACKELNIDPKGKSCVGMEGIIEEAVEVMQENTPSPALDAALIACAQKIEHYEISGYGSAATWAKEMGHAKVLQILTEIMEEEKMSDQKLTELSKTKENLKELQPEGMTAM